MPATKIILQSPVRPFCAGAFLVSLRLAGREFDLLATARVVVDQWHMTQAATVSPQHVAAIGSIHQVVAIRYPLRCHQGQRHRRQTVVHRGARK